MYKLQANFDANGNAIPTNTVIKDGCMWIPFDPANSDYVEYLRWLSEGNTPTPAEEQGA
jgi:phage-related protein